MNNLASKMSQPLENWTWTTAWFRKTVNRWIISEFLSMLKQLKKTIWLSELKRFHTTMPESKQKGFRCILTDWFEFSYIIMQVRITFKLRNAPLLLLFFPSTGFKSQAGAWERKTVRITGLTAVRSSFCYAWHFVSGEGGEQSTVTCSNRVKTRKHFFLPDI